MKINIHKNYYNILDLHLKCTTEEIKKRYKQLAVVYHPDKNIGDNSKDELFKDIVEAYKVLSNQNYREEYDTTSRFGNRYDSTKELYDFEFSNTNKMYDDFDKKIKDFKSNNISDIVVKLYKDDFIEDALSITYERKFPCKKCDATGKNFNGKIQCYICKGLGENREGKKCSLCQGGGYISSVLECDMCDSTGSVGGKVCFMCKGQGKISTNNCTTCNGKATVLKEEKIKLTSKDFVDNKYILKGRGHYSTTDEIYGGLYLILS